MAEWRYRGRAVTAQDIVQIRQLIAENPTVSRRRLSTLLCEAWQWKQANGALRDMVCRGLLLMLHRAGEIELPPIRFRTLNPFISREAPARMLIDNGARLCRSRRSSRAVSSTLVLLATSCGIAPSLPE